MYSIVLLAALTAGEQTPDGCFDGGCGFLGCRSRDPWSGHRYCYGCTGWGGHSHAYGACYGACYGLCYGGWGGGWGLPWSGYGPGYPGNSFVNYGPGLPGPGLHGPGLGNPGYPGSDCFGGYTSAVDGVPGPLLGAPYPGTPTTPAADDRKSEEKTVTSDRAKVIFNLPSDAKLYVDNKQITDAAAKRIFQTPALEKGNHYYYELRAEVTRDGKPVSETRKVIVKAGAVIHADFGELGAATGVAAAK